MYCTMEYQSDQPQQKRRRGRPRNHPEWTEEQRREHRLQQMRNYGQGRSGKAQLRESIASSFTTACHTMNNVTNQMGNTMNNVANQMGNMSKEFGLTARVGLVHEGRKHRHYPSLITQDEAQSERSFDPLPDRTSECSDASTEALLAGNSNHVSDSESVQVELDFFGTGNYVVGDGDDDYDTVFHGRKSGCTYKSDAPPGAVISLRDLYSHKDVACIYKTVQGGDVSWTIHIKERMYQRSIYESAIMNALKAGALEPDGKGNIKVIHNDLVVIVDLKRKPGTCKLITTFRHGSEKPENFGRQPENPDDMEKFEDCRRIFIQQFNNLQRQEHELKHCQQEIVELKKKLQLANEKKEYYKWKCDREEAVDVRFDEEQAYHQSCYKRSIDNYDYDEQIMSPSKRSRRY